ncbi:MAG: zinc ribbon domain-containing protein [Gammaproteobacteria bacterium]|nr:zinc ribbon domain-containing protein [Gammaproteobacteria bacterium]
MPTYDYHCEHNARTVQIIHRMSQDVQTWGDVCAMAKIEVGDTPSSAPVLKVHLGTMRMHRRNVGSDSMGGSAFGAGSTTKAYHNTKNFEAKE